MKRHLVVWIMVLLCLALTSCAINSRSSFLTTDFTNETWQHELDSNKERWKYGADPWFLQAEANKTEMLNKAAPAHRAMSTMSVAVPEISTIKIDGGFETQIYGTDGHDTVDIYGPNAGVIGVSVESIDNDVYVHANQNASPDITKVIVRIGVKHLHQLVQMGCGPIEAIQLTSRMLAIESRPQASGNIYLSGNVRLSSVRQSGSSRITVIGANTSQFNIETNGHAGGVNIYGDVRVRSIVHHGRNDINIIGANSRSLSIFADGSGKVGVKGFTRLNNVTTRDNVRVYVSQSSSSVIHANLCDCSVIGIAGSVGNLTVNTFDSAHFQGRSLCAKNAFVRARSNSHINFTACNKAFAAAFDNSSIFFFGPEYLLNSFKRGKGEVIAIGGLNFCNAASEFRGYDYTGVHRQSPRFVGAG